MHRRLAIVACLAVGAGAQHEHMHMPGMNMDSGNDAGMFLMQQASGTAMNPRSWRMPMIMTREGNWNLMFMGQAWLVETQQSGPRGGDKFYSANWLMFMAEHKVGRGSFLFELMPSLEPATVTGRSYPLLFQTGETAFGKPLIDAQHPHDLFMGLSVQYARPVGEHSMVQVYFAPVGDPALGPVAFPHRASAAELPQATLGHHWQDSTHIANEVVTAAVMHRWVRIEASGFHGREPNENRWNIDNGTIDSWSGRFSVFPAKNWMAQVSAGRLHDPEAEEPGDVVRTTASVHYSRGGWSTSFIWGRNHRVADRHDSDAFGVETVAPVRRANFVTGRFEVVDKDELGLPAARIQAYTAGYTRDLGAPLKHVQAGIGANFTAYAVPDAVRPYYGAHPWGVNVYARFRLR